MFHLFGDPSQGHVIDHGRVACQLRGCDVEVDVCAGCRWCTEIDVDAAMPVVRCYPEVGRFVPWPLR